MAKTPTTTDGSAPSSPQCCISPSRSTIIDGSSIWPSQAADENDENSEPLATPPAAALTQVRHSDLRRRAQLESHRRDLRLKVKSDQIRLLKDQTLEWSSQLRALPSPQSPTPQPGPQLQESQQQQQQQSPADSVDNDTTEAAAVCVPSRALETAGAAASQQHSQDCCVRADAAEADATEADATETEEPQELHSFDTDTSAVHELPADLAAILKEESELRRRLAHLNDQEEAAKEQEKASCTKQQQRARQSLRSKNPPSSSRPAQGPWEHAANSRASVSASLAEKRKRQAVALQATKEKQRKQALAAAIRKQQAQERRKLAEAQLKEELQARERKMEQEQQQQQQKEQLRKVRSERNHQRSTATKEGKRTAKAARSSTHRFDPQAHHEMLWESFEQMHKSTRLRLEDIPFPPRSNVLCRPMGATPDEVQLLFRKAALRWHPDRFVARFGSRLHAEENAAIMTQVKETFQLINAARQAQGDKLG